jgi:hypothetical protein
MKINFYILIILAFTINSCKINQKHNGLKEGKWISYDTINEDVYKYVEKFKKGEDVKIWKTFKNKKLNKKEVFLKDKCLITYYNENKILIISGQTKSEVNEKKSHWFYYGDWNFYDHNGKLVLIKKYINGELISEIEIK